MTEVIYVGNENESKQLQDILFKYGIEWCRGKIHTNIDKNFLIINNNHSLIGWENNFGYIANKIIRKEWMPLNAKDVIENPELIKCIRKQIEKQQEKTITFSDGRKFSESTIKAALKRYIDKE